MSHLIQSGGMAKPPLRIRYFPRTDAEREWQRTWREQEFTRLTEEGKRQRETLRELIAEMDARNRSSYEKAQERKRAKLSSTKPPAIAEVLLYSCTKRRYRNGVVGDRAEIFASDVRSRGRSAAVRFYWIDAAKSLLPLLNRIMPWAVAGEALRRWLGS